MKSTVKCYIKNVETSKQAFNNVKDWYDHEFHRAYKKVHLPNFDTIITGRLGH